MADAKCPVCGCRKFYIKNPDDPYETCEFECRDGEIVYDPKTGEADRPEIAPDMETFCNKCTWHGEFDRLKP